METKTIEERALQVCKLKEIPDEEERYYNRLNCEKYDALVKFGKEQREIDIQRAVEWLKDNTIRGAFLDENGLLDEDWREHFEQAMKGE